MKKIINWITDVKVHIQIGDWRKKVFWNAFFFKNKGVKK